MATENGIGYSPITEKVYLGRQNKNKQMWIGDKKDITNDFLAVSFAFFPPNTIRDIGSSDGSSNLFLNVKNDKKSIERAIKGLTKKLKEIEPLEDKSASLV